MELFLKFRRWCEAYTVYGGGGRDGSLVTKSCPTLLKPHGLSPPGSSVHGVSQAIILEWVAISFSRDLPDTGTEPASPA